ncbi:glutamine--fructose-6-phosphate transaminase (isomerizing) [Hydrogenovibrio marinus]|uniref:Glutamine--fructose-6-phosphate aminotransferase [isomerizing] n=1 Tax=Hydrogenovibrio marinus TaxID=28885 RepID=A0A067A2A5_HYDMR|nr:glutamine--fructose-6-phosphate transaminase (isomerizing) [Hydrogenovibrio marinus]KDN96731.1 glucosamine--fructose-6-phosphate aminotransferase [Hydrogenovibrio marinus]BBN58971.1 glutamine--fructose-6-phosphate aminotransferase [isomerizing] [Hydrogenovibrio marinus]
MCGIVGGVAERNVVPILLEGLRRLEYRGYDSSGIALLNSTESPKKASFQIQRLRAVGKIKELDSKIQQNSFFDGNIGIAHTRWATHGVPSENNAHPHICNNEVAVVHNGIIENYHILKEAQLAEGYRFTSETDTEVVAHAVHYELKTSTSLLSAVQQAITHFEGAYALGVISPKFPDTLIAARKGSPLVIGVGIGEFFIASDVSALLPVTQNFIFLEEGDVAELTRQGVTIFNGDGEQVEREVKQSSLNMHSVELGDHRHYMHKEIFEQPQAVIDTLEGRISQEHVLPSAFGYQAESIFKEVKQVQIIACGTSYHAGLVSKYWFEDIIGLPCSVEVASEYRYRNPVVQDNTLFVTISQSGETADTLAALQQIKQVANEKNVSTLTICNVPESSLTRESDLTFLTHAGPEIGVASTKAFTTQLVALSLLVTVIGKLQKRISERRETIIVKGLQKLPGLIQSALAHEEVVKEIAKNFSDKDNALFLGRGTMYPIAMEGALKLKEISYIHAEAYPAGELKHGPLALIDENIPVIAIAPHNDLLEKLKSNLQEVKARGGQMIVFEDEQSNVGSEDGLHVVKTTTNVGRITAPITFNVPLQLLAYHVALIKGTDVDQPRNLAKSVTVE